MTGLKLAKPMEECWVKMKVEMMVLRLALAMAEKMIVRLA
jgi:hypothetical protein